MQEKFQDFLLFRKAVDYYYINQISNILKYHLTFDSNILKYHLTFDHNILKYHLTFEVPEYLYMSLQECVFKPFFFNKRNFFFRVFEHFEVKNHCEFVQHFLLGINGLIH